MQENFDDQNKSDSSDSFELLSYDDDLRPQKQQKSKKKLKNSEANQDKIKELKKDLYEAQKKIKMY